MEKIIAQVHGCKIIDRDGQNFVQFDEGEIVVRIVEYPINHTQIQRLLTSEKEAYAVLLEIQRQFKH